MLLVSVFTLGSVFATTFSASDVAITVSVQDDKVEISKDELPEKVSTAFDASKYASLTLGKVYKVTKDSGEVVYQFVLADADGNEVVAAYDAEGSEIEE
ncbi:hypothetical protein AAG747_10490 [Rapidithrix thailandica]|uniref:PepSY domain-containing protein n=1 Tax=Rapidithrix thailandica TaxID=413964 RepID=A0AAW9RTW4_9BACT